jgi:hypothetical protein
MSDMRKVLAMSGLAVLLYLSGCSGGSSPSTTSITTTPPPTTTPSTPDVVGSGSWTATALSSSGQLSTIIVQFQGQNQLTGKLQVLGDSAFDATTSFPVTGSIDSSGKITFSGTQGQEKLSVSATASADGSTLKGTYTASGPVTESGNIVGVHPPSVTGSYTGTYSDTKGDSVSETLAVTPGSPVAGTFGVPVTGTAQASSPALTLCGPGNNPGSSEQFQFTGSQIGANISGILMSGTTQWGQLSGALSSDGTTLNGTVTIINGACAGTSLNGTVANTSKPQPQQPSAQDITFSITNNGPDAGEVFMNGQSVQCPAVPHGLTGGVSCGQIVIPAGADSVQISAVPTVDGDYASVGSPCPQAGSSIESPNLPAGCTWPAVPLSAIAFTSGQKVGGVAVVGFTPSNRQNTYSISGNVAGSGQWNVDDNLDVYRNGTLIYTTGNGFGTVHPPFNVLASIGDKIRFVTRDTFGGSSGLAELYLTCSTGGSSVVADPGFITNPSNGGVTQDLTFTVPSMSGCIK